MYNNTTSESAKPRTLESVLVTVLTRVHSACKRHTSSRISSRSRSCSFLSFSRSCKWLSLVRSSSLSGVCPGSWRQRASFSGFSMRSSRTEFSRFARSSSFWSVAISWSSPGMRGTIRRVTVMLLWSSAFWILRILACTSVLLSSKKKKTCFSGCVTQRSCFQN